MQQPTPAKTSAAASPLPRELKPALAALGLRCIAGIGASALGPLRLVNTPDVRLEVKRQRMYWPTAIEAKAELYVPEALADALVGNVLFLAQGEGVRLRGSWINARAVDLCGMIERELAALAPGVKPMTPQQRLNAAERWLAKQWGG
jgi:hypothetical protein